MEANLTKANLSWANLRELRVGKDRPSRSVSLSLRKPGFWFVWDIKVDDRTNQLNLVISRSGQAAGGERQKMP
jgi:hypothetical protein